MDNNILIKIRTPGEWTLRTELPVQYTIKNSHGIFSIENPDILEHGNKVKPRRLIVIDKSICQYYLDGIVEYMKHYQVDYHIVALSATEEKKDLKTLVILLEEMEQFGLMRRDEPLIAIGGGALLDIAGLAANLYRRGIPYIRVPTTLVGLVDASVGAKTGINFERRRNRLGSYYPPTASYLDKTFLKTLEPIEISSGLGEILKMAVVKDAKLFNILEHHGPDLLKTKFEGSHHADEVINLATQGMKDELETNLWETNLERLVDFGHSFSPIIEMRSIHESGNIPLTHGQAVTLDVIFSSIISYHRNWLSNAELMRIVKTAYNMQLPIYHRLFTDPLVLLEALEDTVKHRNGNQNLPIPIAIGESIFVNDLTLPEIKKAAAYLEQLKSHLFEECAL